MKLSIRKEKEANQILAHLLGVQEKQIEEAVKSFDDYKQVKIPKRSGGHRTIYIPPESLKKIQRRIKNRILKKIWPEQMVGINGLNAGSYVDHVYAHMYHRFFFQFDLKDAFTSVNIGRLGEILYKKIGNFEFKKKNLSFDLLIPAEFIGDVISLIINLVTVDMVLPQGAPTSPFLFFIVLAEGGLIPKIERILRKKFGYSEEPYRNPIITCYVDNFLISATKEIPEELREEILAKVEESGFKVNPKKIRYQDFRNGSPMICGLHISEKVGYISGPCRWQRRIGLPRRIIRKWRGIIHQAQFNPELRKKVEGFIAFSRPIYKKGRPNQILAPYQKFLRSLS